MICYVLQPRTRIARVYHSPGDTTLLRPQVVEVPGETGQNSETDSGKTHESGYPRKTEDFAQEN